MSERPRIDRRQFARDLVTTTSIFTAVAASTVIAVADDKTKNEEQSEKGAVPQALPREELLLLHCLMQRYPSPQLDEDAIRGIYGDLRGDVARGRILSEFPLKNSDEPSFVFRAYRGAE